MMMRYAKEPEKKSDYIFKMNKNWKILFYQNNFEKNKLREKPCRSLTTIQKLGQRMQG
jgi:hypothetical protein